MKKLGMTIGVVLSGLMVTSALAGEVDSAAPPPQGQEQPAVQGEVPQAQADYFKKREDAKKRRDEAEKVRAQAVRAEN